MIKMLALTKFNHSISYAALTLIPNSRTSYLPNSIVPINIHLPFLANKPGLKDGRNSMRNVPVYGLQHNKNMELRKASNVNAVP